MMDTVINVLGKYSGYESTHRKFFPMFNPEVVCTIQDCNIGGSYFRNFFVHDDRIHWFTSGTDFFDNKDYNEKQISKYVWKRTLKSLDDSSADQDTYSTKRAF